MKKHILPLLLCAAVFAGCSTAPQENPPLDKSEYIDTAAEADKKAVYYSITTVSDAENTKTLSEIFAEEDSLERLKEMNDALHENFDYLEFGLQPLYYTQKYEGDLRFTDAVNADVINLEIDTGSEPKYTTPLKTIQMDEEIFSAYADHIEEGEGFSVEYLSIGNAGDEINIILGSDYKEHSNYALNDTMELDFYGKQTTFRIKGFLKPDTRIKTGIYGRSTLDDCIVMPYISANYAPDSEAEENFQKILYSQKNLGLIKTEADESFEEAEKQVSELAKDAGLLLRLHPTAADVAFG